jgi:hypothetical protein
MPRNCFPPDGQDPWDLAVTLVQRRGAWALTDTQARADIARAHGDPDLAGFWDQVAQCCKAIQLEPISNAVTLV